MYLATSSSSSRRACSVFVSSTGGKCEGVIVVDSAAAAVAVVVCVREWGLERRRRFVARPSETSVLAWNIGRNARLRVKYGLSRKLEAASRPAVGRLVTGAYGESESDRVERR